ncbi:carboxypeptidase-like regulatory domain-containing protein [Bacteroides fragilis]|uniref:TonB C-terminal domain-containing protein n=1 Tax=Bacteroides fragilis TaxID=817 RepID=A0AAP8ZX38_BACFG|nr:energy transducer TonB [Bacteroides fragilis]MBV4153030.1 carboxypeptidase-like regulatory domain-containing protein [Bacteroides fragilis]MCE8577811.1 carboxypeptidase-like regulatory domain-containing protein [Bacteroides fragilis]MCE8648636.1 carboxypeptidase-like regulatory domain-containing protein [Bacteroides fragilis]MCM0347726.1 carboxypeptidase-like regulatory domain-containing protein [Bacteroides fragilis]MCM0367651.1 carboxypeptidase-like regulatory domain-containing protein [B
MKLLDYIRGARKGKEAHRLEKEAMRDPFLADALEGYSCVGNGADEQIEELRRRIRARAVRKRNHAVVWSIAASLLIGVCIGSYFLFQEKPLSDEARMAMEQAVHPKPLSVYEEEKKDELAEVVIKDSAGPSKKLISENKKKKMLAPSSEVPQVMTQELMEEALEATIDDEPSAMDKKMVMRASVANDSSFNAKVAVVGKVRGKVTDPSGEPLVGATVRVKGTNQGTISDENGDFTLKTDGNRELSVDYIGYESVVLPADTTKDLLIAMNVDDATLDEVVVVGYGSQPKSSVTGAIMSLKMSGTPQPSIGRKAFRRYLKENLVHPSDKECARAKGKVILTFRVDKDGRPESISVKKGLCASADKEAIRLIEEGPDWTIGDEPVEVSIRF